MTQEKVTGIDPEDARASRSNEFADLLAQLGDVDAKRKAGVIDDDEWAEQKARALAFTAALEKLAGGDDVSDDELAEILDTMREVVAEPTQEEINAANIDYLLMIGGDE